MDRDSKTERERNREMERNRDRKKHKDILTERERGNTCVGAKSQAGKSKSKTDPSRDTRTGKQTQTATLRLCLRDSFDMTGWSCWGRAEQKKQCSEASSHVGTPEQVDMVSGVPLCSQECPKFCSK